jgi:hypothetical protein
MWGFNPFEAWWKPSSYTKWYWYPVMMPCMGLLLLYVLIVNGLYNLFRR